MAWIWQHSLSSDEHDGRRVPGDEGLAVAPHDADGDAAGGEPEAEESHWRKCPGPEEERRSARWDRKRGDRLKAERSSFREIQLSWDPTYKQVLE